MPLIKKPSYIGVDSFLSNYNIVLDLLRYRLNKYISYDIHSLFDVLHQDLVGTSLNSLDIETSLDFLKDKLYEGEGKKYLYKLFEFLASEHFTDSNGNIVLNIDHIEEFQSLINSIDMTPIYATAVDKFISHYPTRDKIIYTKERINNTILSYPSRFNFLTMVSDNHFHLGGSLHITYRLNEIFKNPFLVKDTIGGKNLQLITLSASLFEKIIYTYLIKKDFYKDEKLHIYIDKIFNDITRRILDNNILNIQSFKNNNTKDEIFHFISFREDIVNQDIFNEKTYRNSLISNIYYAHQKGELQKSDKLFWLLIIDYIKDGKNKIIIDIIYIYIVLRNVLREYIIQQHFKEGLTYFSTVSRSPIRRSKIHQEYVDSFRSIFLPNFNVNIEGRINFQDSAKDLAEEMHNWLESFFIVEYENTQHVYKENQLSFILHFQKKADKKSINIKNQDYHDIRYISRYKDYRLDIFRKTEVFFRFLRSPQYKRYIIPIITSKNLKQLKKKFYDIECLEKQDTLSTQEQNILDRLKNLNLNKHFFIKKKYCQQGFISAIEVDLTQYISGIDAASREYNTPPEVFAPVFNYIRGSMEISRISFENKNMNISGDIPNHFQFTFHVGEDFRDILTGMRNVVEAIVFLGLKKGDRIGHALALGLRHQQWAKKKRRVFSSREEQFDNAVFAYFILNLFSQEKEIKEHYYQKALHLGNEIYQANFTIDNYINAWLLRRNCPINLKNYTDKFQEKNIINNHLNSNQINDILKILGIDNYINSSYTEIAKRCAKTSIHADIEEYQIKNFRHLTRSKLYFERSLPDLFKDNETYKDNLSKRYKWAQSDAIAWEIFLRYHYDKDVKDRAKKKMDEPMKSAKYTEILQDLILEHIVSKRDIIIEVMPSSNVLNSYIEDYHNHPIFRFKPVDLFENFNKYGIRKNPIRVIINTDNPGFQATSYINELFLIYNAGLKLGYSAEKIEKYIKDIVDLGNSIFMNRASQE